MARQSAKMSSSNKIRIWSLIFLILSVFLGLILYTLTKESLKTTPVIITTKDIKAGKMISEGDLATISVGKNGIQSNIATIKADVVGKYATRDLKANEYVFNTSITDDYMKRLSEKAKFGAIAIPIDNLQSVTGDIKENDFVGAYISVNINKDSQESTAQQNQAQDVLPNATTALIYSKDLTAIRVLGIYDSNGNIAGKESAVTDENGNTSYTSPSMIVFDAMPEQRTLLFQAIDNGRIRLIVHPEYIQNKFRKGWGLEGSASVDTPEGQIQEDEMKKKLDEQENIKTQHEALVNDKSVTTYMDDVKSDVQKEENEKKLTPEHENTKLTLTVPAKN